MKASRETKRLFVGGLGQTISEADLQNQFSRFGEVSDVEIITRKDDQGNPQKVFAYVNIRIAEGDLKKCMSVLNKTKWKGGTLQIQLAKESFLHRLAQEREEAKAKKENSTGNTSLLEKMGSVDFHMKAVPGTEVPGHKNWVVSKFGRVLPVLHLKNQHKRKIIKYDPSKYCHNLKKIGEDFTDTIPVSSLTWELEGGNDPMSKKRRGEFSDFSGPPRKIIKIRKDEGSTGSVSVNLRASRVAETSQKTSGLETGWKRNSMSDDDIDSEDELRAMIAEEEKLQRTLCSSINESENDPFEVVKEDFKSDVHKLHSLTGLGVKNNTSGPFSNVESDCEYDSGDTDKIFAMKKTASKMKNSAEFSQKEKSTRRKTLKTRENGKLSDQCVKVQKRKSNVESALSNHTPLCEPSSSEDADPASESEGDEEYNTMMKNCPRLSLTLADLEQIAACDPEVTKEDTESDNPESTTCNKFDKASKSPKAVPGLRRGRQCINPEDIVASLLEEESTYAKRTPKENLKPKFQAFKGVGSLYGEQSVQKLLKESPAANNKDQNSFKQDSNSVSTENGSPFANGSSSKHVQSQKRQPTFDSQSLQVVSPNSSEKGSRNPVSGLLPLKGKTSLNLSAKTHKTDHDEDGCHNTTEAEGTRSDPGTSLEKSSRLSLRKHIQESKTDFSHSVSNSSDADIKDKHAEDNQKRLAALEARQRAKEMQKKLVHNALANVEPMGKASGKLFDSSDDEESDAEDDSNRFKIKPQFEGRAGQKLMDLQSHFGTDDRFRMDSRFLESDSEEEQEEINEEKTAEEEEFAAEKKKALNVVQSVLQMNLSSSSSKGTVAAKKFKDIIRYDPTRHDHATYERKKDEKPKESKAKRKKKREEAEKLPEVSKEMYYNIAMDLKEIFQTTKGTSEKEEDMPRNEDCGGEKAQEIQDPAALTNGDRQPAGFTFSFFDSDTTDVKEETYRVETVKPAKIVSKGDPRFQDSSSEEEEEVTEETDRGKPSPEEASLPEKQTSRFFFFSKDDERLHGSDLFWRGVGSNISRNSWEARTKHLLMDCRKKHKEAKRRVKQN
uniref:Nucleolar protein 8 n=1 Tax=Oryctolagus cuniculus TaxID=9986 RepID=G1SUD4_RABIT